MEETITEIEKLLTKNRDEDKFYKEKENVEENKKNNSCYSVISSDCNSLITPGRSNPKNITKHCILCRDYSSPICTNCKQRPKVSKSKNKRKTKIVPNGKVKALAKQFEHVFPEIKNDSPFSSCKNVVITANELNNYLMNREVTHNNGINNTHNRSQKNSISSDNLQNSPSNISASSTSSSLSKRKITPIKDPDICGLVDPIETIFNSSNNTQFVEIKDCSIIEGLNRENIGNFESNVISLENLPEEGENMHKNEDNIIFAFESLNHIEQRALLISWITMSLNSKGSNHTDSEIDDEIMKLLRELVEDLEYRNFSKSSENSQNFDNEVNSEIHEVSVPYKKKQSSSLYELKTKIQPNLTSKFRNSGISSGHLKTKNNPNFFINIGIPEDEEIEENYIDYFISRTNFKSKIEVESVIIDESELSPKSEITLFDNFEDENSITTIGNNFFGFFN
ncbi:hypothetical protein FG386_001618 [Cryptosporidium ryanae]|uniref:uncharacterized protein n=1 Tax=Cryptosporidium ryanae TaxID=515981 RepID=UPI00351A7C03|nr:hypothetical protein FG386_001618 [Cryptosporidium ryanae]